MLNILTSPEARIIDIFTMWADQEKIYLACLPGRGSQTAQMLASRVFFMDRVQVSDLSQDYVQFEIYTSHPNPPGQSIFGEPLPEEGGLRSFEIQDHRVFMMRPLPAPGPGSRLIAPVTLKSSISEQLLASGCRQLSPLEYEIQRIETGTPGFETELTTDYTPLENDLGQAVSLRKGCYTGQEVLARQVNFDKVTRSLQGLLLEKPVHQGDRILMADRAVGVVTSTVLSPRFGPIALAMIRRPHDRPGTRLDIATQEGESTQGEVASLPFSVFPS